MRALGRVVIGALALLGFLVPSAAAAPSSGQRTFVSAPNVHLPRLGVLMRRPGLAKGDFLVASLGNVGTQRWEVMAGSSSGNLTVVASHARPGFETAIGLGRTYPVYEVRALSAAGSVLGTSKGFS
jgi:hypothetical protein